MMFKRLLLTAFIGQLSSQTNSTARGKYAQKILKTFVVWKVAAAFQWCDVLPFLLSLSDQGGIKIKFLIVVTIHTPS